MKPKDRDFIKTLEGFLFCVVGYLHPPDSYTAYLKYVPSKTGRWKGREFRYRRVMDYYSVSQVEKTNEWLKEHHPKYIFYDPVRNITIPTVPESRVQKYYHPRERLHAILTDGPKDPLEEKLVNLIYILSNISDIKQEDFGVTGSILTEIHSPEFSDLDVTVYGHESSTRVRNSLMDVKHLDGSIKNIDFKFRMRWIENRSNHFNLEKQEVEFIASKRWNYGIFKGTYFSIHPTRVDEEIKERYGDWRYRHLGVITGTATIRDNKESIYLPAVYELENVRTGIIQLPEVRYLVSFEGMYGGLYDIGEDVEFKAVLEEASSEQENIYRILIGGAGSSGCFVRRKDG